MSSLREVAWRRSCPDVIRARINEATSERRLLFVSRSGPTGFMIMDSNTKKKHKVLLGRRNTCTCQTHMREHDLCVHILWVLVKKLRIPTQNPLVWQQSFIDREVQELLSSSAQQHQAEEQVSAISSSSALEQVNQREVTEEEVCPICQCELLGDGDPLVYCRFGCGGSVHSQCMLEWAKHAHSQGDTKSICCPLCRASFGSYDETRRLCLSGTRKDVRVRENNLHLGFACGKCKTCPIQGKLYTCTSCVSFHLCQACFSKGEHPNHNFSVKDSPKVQPKVVSRVALPVLMIERLQQRDLSDEDYHMLLLLDQPAAVSTVSECDLEEQVPAFVINRRHPLAQSHSQCAICTHDLVCGNAARTLACRHTFHKGCIDPYLTQQRNTCPIDGLTAISSQQDPAVPASSPQQTDADTQRRPERRSFAGHGAPHAHQDIRIGHNEPLRVHRQQNERNALLQSQQRRQRLSRAANVRTAQRRQVSVPSEQAITLVLDATTAAGYLRGTHNSSEQIGRQKGQRYPIPHTAPRRCRQRADQRGSNPNQMAFESAHRNSTSTALSEVSVHSNHHRRALPLVQSHPPLGEILPNNGVKLPSVNQQNDSHRQHSHRRQAMRIRHPQPLRDSTTMLLAGTTLAQEIHRQEKHHPQTISPRRLLQERQSATGKTTSALKTQTVRTPMSSLLKRNSENETREADTLRIGHHHTMTQQANKPPTQRSKRTAHRRLGQMRVTSTMANEGPKIITGSKIIRTRAPAASNDNSSNSNAGNTR